VLRLASIGMLLCVILTVPGFPSANAGEPAPSSPAIPVADAGKLADGLYLVLRSAREAKSLEPIADTEKLVANDFHLLEAAEREPVLYMVLQTKPFVPLLLGANPKEDKEESTGKPRLQLELAEGEKAPLEEFTREHFGGTVAIVIGGDVVTFHKVKAVITGGRLQITRCTKHGCEVLYTRLLKDRPETQK
jgi:hypothetical protein